MRKLLFLVHDPGGYDFIFPIIMKFHEAQLPFCFFCIGPAAKLNREYAVTEEQFQEALTVMINNDEIMGLFSGTSWGNSIELQTALRIKKMGLPTIACIDYWSNYLMRFRLEEAYVFPDYCIIMDELGKSEAIEAGIPESILYALGQPGLDRFVDMQVTRKPKTIESERTRLLFISQPINHLYGDKLGYTEKDVWKDCLHLLELEEGYSLNIKFHPKDDSAFKVINKQYAVEGNLQDLLSNYHVLIGMDSMGLLHGALMGIPTISYQPNLKQPDECITNKLGLTKSITSFPELLDHLNLIIRNKVNSSPKNELDNFIWHDGKSGERIFSFLRGILNL